MQGSFTPDSAEKFLALMREAGYETSDLADTGKFQNFSEGVKSRGEQQFVAKSGEARGEYIENYDYTRCVRPNGTAYGTGGTCRKGTPEEKGENDAIGQLASMLPKGSKIVESSGRTQTVGAKGKVKAALTGEHWAVINEKMKEVGEKLSRQEGLLKRMSDSPKFDDLRKTTQDKIEKLSSTYKKLNQTKMQIRDSLEKERTETGRIRPLVPENLTPNGVTKFPSKARISQAADPSPSKGATSDKKKRGAKPGGMRVTEKIKALGAKDLEKVLSDPRLNDRQREQLNKLLSEKSPSEPVSATARQAVEVKPKPKTKKLVSDPTPDEKWEKSRMETYNSLKGMTRDQLVNRYRQSSRLDMGSLTDLTMRDLKGAIVSSVHGNYSPSEQRKRMAEKVEWQKSLRQERDAEKERATASKAAEAAPKRELRGQELGNAMVLNANITERVRANYGGTLATKKARAELQAALDKEGALNREEISRMLKTDRAERL